MLKVEGYLTLFKPLDNLIKIFLDDFATGRGESFCPPYGVTSENQYEGFNCYFQVVDVYYKDEGSQPWYQHWSLWYSASDNDHSKEGGGGGGSSDGDGSGGEEEEEEEDADNDEEEEERVEKEKDRDGLKEKREKD